MQLRALVAASIAVVASCYSNPAANVCTNARGCDREAGGQCWASPAGYSSCAYPDSECPEGYRWDDLHQLSNACVHETDLPPVDVDAGDVVDAATDGADVADAATDDAPQLADASIDARPAPSEAIAVGYVNRFRISGNGTSATGWVRIANVGSRSLDMRTLRMSRVSVEPPLPTGTTVSLNIYSPEQNVAILPPGQSVGLLTNRAKVLLLDSGLMPEPTFDSTRSYVTINVMGLPVYPWGQFAISYRVQVEGLTVPITVTIAQESGVFEATAARALSYTP